MEKYIPIVGYFDLSSLKGNGHLYEAEINRVRGLYEVLYYDNNIRCCDRGDYPKKALSHMGFRFVTEMEKAVPTEHKVDGSDVTVKEESDETVSDVVVEQEHNKDTMTDKTSAAAAEGSSVEKEGEDNVSSVVDKESVTTEHKVDGSDVTVKEESDETVSDVVVEQEHNKDTMTDKTSAAAAEGSSVEKEGEDNVSSVVDKESVTTEHKVDGSDVTVKEESDETVSDVVVEQEHNKDTMTDKTSAAAAEGSSVEKEGEDNVSSVVDKESVTTDVTKVAADNSSEICVILDSICNKHNIYCISVGRDDTFYSFAKPNDDKNDDAWLNPSLFPDLKITHLKFGVKYTELMSEEERKNMDFSWSIIKEAVQILSGGYKEEIKEEWCKAVVLLFAITSEAVRSKGVCDFVKMIFEDETNTTHKMPPKVLKEMNKWGKISDVAYGHKKSFCYEWLDGNSVGRNVVSDTDDVAQIFAVINAPKLNTPQDKFQKLRRSLSSHHALIGSPPPSMRFSPIMMRTKSYSTFLPGTVAQTKNFFNPLMPRFKSKCTFLLLPKIVAETQNFCDMRPLNGSSRAVSGGMMFKAIATAIRVLKKGF